MAMGCKAAVVGAGMLLGNASVTGCGRSMSEGDDVGVDIEIESLPLTGTISNGDGAAAGNGASPSERGVESTCGLVETGSRWSLGGIGRGRLTSIK
jgi:hypothetical protein